jgi:hypothetical protein
MTVCQRLHMRESIFLLQRNFLNLYQNESNASVCSENTVKNNDTSVE